MWIAYHASSSIIFRLSRFLGSRVPTNLILGVDEGSSSPPLPPISPRGMGPSQDIPERPQWMRRRRNSSEAILSGWSDDVDRSQEQLDDREKAMNVRRAHKMEKVRCLYSHPLGSVFDAGFRCSESHLPKISTIPASHLPSYSLSLLRPARRAP